MENLKKIILSKKELKGIPSDFLDKYIEEYKSKNPKTFRVLVEKNFNEKSKEFDDLKKYIRKKLREVHGVFSKEPLGEEKKKKYVFELKKNSSSEEEIIEKILNSHQSTFERISQYSELYKKIFQNKLPKKIIDLGCGYNPFSYNYIFSSTNTKETEQNKPEIICADINSEDMKFIQEYFDFKKIKGKSLTLDLCKEENIKLISEESKNSDVCFMFKLLDSLESKKRGTSDLLLKNIFSDKIVVSFPLKTISGKSQIKGERRWFERIRQKYVSDEFILGEEKYVILYNKNK